MFSYRISQGIVECFTGDAFVGFLSWHTNGVIAFLSVREQWRGLGVARKMFELANEQCPDLQHSTRLTDDGARWVQKLSQENGRKIF